MHIIIVKFTLYDTELDKKKKKKKNKKKKKTHTHTVHRFVSRQNNVKVQKYLKKILPD